MPLRSQPFSGSGRLTPDGVRKLNALTNRSEMFGGNNTSPITRTPTGTIAQYRRRVAYREDTSPLMFQVESHTGAKITIRCGACRTWTAGVETDVPTYRVAGNSWDPNNTVEVTVSGSTWIIGTMDDPDDPTKVTISASGSTFTSGHIAAVIADIQAVPTSSNIDLFYGESATGNPINSFLKGFGKATYVFDLASNTHTQMSTTGTAGTTTAKGWLKVLVEGVTRYIPLSDSAT